MNPKKWSRKAQIITGAIAALFIVAGIAGKEPEPTTAEAAVTSTVAPIVPPATEAPVVETVPATTAVPVTTQAPTTVPATTAAPTTTAPATTAPATTEVPVTTPATTEAPTTTSSVDIPGLAAQMTWDGLSASEQSDICDGYGLFGSDWVYNSLLEGITGGGEPSVDDKILGLALVDVIQKEC